MKTTFGVPVVLVAFAASLAAAISLGDPASVQSGEPAVVAGSATTASHTGGRGIVDAFPTPEAGFAIRRAVGPR